MTLSQFKKVFFNRFRKEYEKQIRISEKVSYRQARKIYLDAFIEGSKLYLNNQSFNALELVDVIKFRNLYIDIYRDTGLRFAKWYRNLFEKVATKQTDPSYDLWDAIFTQYGESQAGRLVTTVNQTMQAQFLSKIEKQFADPVFQTLGAQDQARILASEGFWSKQSRWMALRVARTENNTAANLAIEESSLTLFGADEMVKIWQTSADERVRRSHAALEGKDPIPFNDYFKVGSVSMKRPNDPEAIGDPKAIASEVINCRCRLITIPKESVLEDSFSRLQREYEERQRNTNGSLSSSISSIFALMS